MLSLANKNLLAWTVSLFLGVWLIQAAILHPAGIPISKASGGGVNCFIQTIISLAVLSMLFAWSVRALAYVRSHSPRWLAYFKKTSPPEV